MRVTRFIAALALGAVLVGGCGGGGGNSPQANEPPASNGPTYYVSPQGSDSNKGSRDKPWATPGYASRQLKPGDTLVILGGRYVLSRYDEDIVIPPSGAAGAWITIKGEVGNRPVLAGRDDLYCAVQLGGASCIRLQNIEITHDATAAAPALNFRGGVFVNGHPSSHIVLQDLYIHHIDEGAVDLEDVNDIQILNCRFQYCGFGCIGGPTGQQGGIRNLLVRDCELSYSGHYYQGGDGSNRPYDRPDGLGLEGSTGPIEIANTVSQHNFGDGLDSKCANTYIHECVVANNSCDGVKLWGSGSRLVNTLIYGRGDGDTEPSQWAAIVVNSDTNNSSIEITNVTVDDFVGATWLMHAQTLHPTTPLKLTVRNCIFCARGERSPIHMETPVSYTFQNCLFYAPLTDYVLEYGAGDGPVTEYTQAQISQFGSGNKYGDPLFVTPAFGADGDYHLQNGSPAIDAGIATNAPGSDIAGSARPQGGGFDIGAYER